MRKLIKRTLVSLLILAAVVGSVFASPLKPGTGFGDAKVYDNNYKAMPNATEISDGFVIRTSKDAVILDNGTTHVELDSNSLAVFTSLENGLQIYILDGKMLVSSTSGDFTIMTTVTTYNAKSGSSIYVITDATDEIGFVSEGSAEAHNFIMKTSTKFEAGQYIDNSVSGFPPSPSSVANVWGEPRKEPEPPVQQAEPEKKQETKISPLRRTFTYGNLKATITAYQGYAEISYPTFITNEEIITAAAAAAAAYPQYMDGIFYEIKDAGKLVLYYPENYGEGELNLAMNLINAELPAYIASLAAPQPEPTAVVATAEVPEAPVEPVQQETVVEQPAQPQTEKTPLETVPRPEQPEPEPEKKSDFKFGLWAGGVYGKGNDGDDFAVFPYSGERIGTFWKNYSFFLRPYISFKGFTFGLNAEAQFINNNFQVKNYEFDTEHGITGYVNSVAKYISALGYESENFTLMFDMKNNLTFNGPIFNSADRLYATSDKLSGRLNLKAGVFSLDGFVDDIRLTAKMEGRSQYAGIRAGLTLGSLNFGIGAVADYARGVKNALFYPTADFSFPFNLAGTRIKLSAEAAAQIGISGGFKLNGFMGKAMINVGYGPMDIGLGAAYNRNRHFSNLITNAPVTTDTFNEGTSFDAIAQVKLDTKVFSFKTAFSIPVSENGGRFANKIKTRSGNIVDSSADVMDFQTDLRLGSFTFTLGASIYGFSGKVSDAINSATDKEALKEALLDMISPETSTIFAKLDFNTPVGFGVLDVFARLDLAVVESRLRLPLSIGASYSF